jgi:uncharacterized repeat protein (TIGR03803 family)
MRGGKGEMTCEVCLKTTLGIGWWKTFGILCVLSVVAATGSPAQTEQSSATSVKFTDLVSFDGTNGSDPQPYADLVQGRGGNLYGTTYRGGANSSGTVFKMTPAGALTTLYSFCSQASCADGSGPAAGLVRGADGNFYGATVSGGAYFFGTVFKITPSGTLTSLYSFCSGGFPCTDGWYPIGGPIQGSDGNFYGTTNLGGANPTCYFGDGCGTIFKITPTGTLTTLYNFCSQANCDDGYSPVGSLVQATDGNLYGTTYFGGSNSDGTIFEITPSGTLTTLHSFDGTDGSAPVGALIEATDGNFYGTTSEDGAYGHGTIFKISSGAR